MIDTIFFPSCKDIVNPSSHIVKKSFLSTFIGLQPSIDSIMLYNSKITNIHKEVQRFLIPLQILIFSLPI